MSKLKFNLLLVSSLLFLSSCSNIKVYVNNKDYADYEQFVLPTLEDFYTLNEDNYFIYLYSDSCSHCDDIKKDIFSYLEKMKDPSFNSTVLYIYNMHSNKTNEGIVNRNHFKKIDESEGKTQEQLINEMINLEHEIVNNKVKIKILTNCKMKLNPDYEKNSGLLFGLRRITNSSYNGRLL